ncbi:LCP family protein [Alkalicoccus chagannorensis]|uniref:LCP family glycopolymer transferase n=1 Tax=Alkalicoccus chagannorensis TaxID=427072 RepID=UPI000479CFBA|nr:LCP family protein [Alkalicoccus chagannorensis]
MKKLLVVAGSLLAVVLLVIGGAAFWLYQSVENTVAGEMHEQLDREKSDLREADVDLDGGQPASFLLLGVDAEASDAGRTDTMMVVTVNPKEDSMRMVSLPRDTRMPLAGREGEDKVNHAYAFGGADMAMRTVEDYFGIPIDYVVSVNMDGLQDVIDTLGGITVHNELAFEENQHAFPVGDIALSGEEALSFVRMRQEDPAGDLGRNARQREVVTAMIREGAQFSNITNIRAILTSMREHVRTNLELEEMIQLQQHYADTRYNQEILELTGAGERIDGIWYLIVPDDERQRVSDELQEHLEL